MSTLRKKTHRKIAIAFLTLICLTEISVPLYHAHAVVPVIDLVVEAAIEKAETARKFDAIAARTRLEAIEAEKIADLKARDAQSFLERYVIWPAIRVLIFTLIQTLTNQTVAWISGDEGRNVGFVKNLEQNAKTEADARAGEFLNHLSGINLCSVNLKKLVKLQLTTPGFQHLNTQLECSLTGIVNNVDNFYRDFSQGGWPAFVSIAVNPQNNAFGASMIAQINLEAAKASAKKASDIRIAAGNLFQGVMLTKDSNVCDWLPDLTDPISGDVIPAHQSCHTEKVTTTPGQVVADALNENLNHVGVDMSIGMATAISSAVSSAVDQAIVTIANAMISRLFKESGNLF